ncbi:MAG: hypothetical protein ACI4OJ_06440 [Lachnospiraceae bacterium]
MKPSQLSMLVLILGICSMALSELSLLGPVLAVITIILGIVADRKVCREKRDKNRIRIGFLAAFFGITTFVMMLVLAHSISPEELNELGATAAASQ